jgi:tetratricopeptide (TPR) repeat protein
VSLLGAALVSWALGACVYYNGMYNANRLASSARKAEREGRTFQANGLWGQVATKAESVLVRHPTSKYAAEAGLLRGVALARLGQCDQALNWLSRLLITERRSDLTEEALLASGRCQLVLGNLSAAEAAFSQLRDSKNQERRQEARFQQARLLRQAGQYEGALAALAGIQERRADAERVLALAAVGRLPAALALTDSMIARGDTTKRWDSLVVILGKDNPSAASVLLDRVRRISTRTPELQSRMLLEDGLRLRQADPARAARRFREAMTIGGNGEAASRAGLALIQLHLSRATQPSDLTPLLDSLKQLDARSDLATDEITRFASSVADVHTAAVSVTVDSVHGDLHLFLAAESARDVLGAHRLAEAMFRRIPVEWPGSPYGPKAILAAQQLNPGWADSARALLDERYFDSPYVAAVWGEATPEYRQLEDSLGAFAAALALAKSTESRRTSPAADRPGRRLQPTSRRSKVQEPK